MTDALDCMEMAVKVSGSICQYAYFDVLTRISAGTVLVIPATSIETILPGYIEFLASAFILEVERSSERLN